MQLIDGMGDNEMRELSNTEVYHISGAHCSVGEIVGYSFVSSALSLGAVKLLTSASVSKGLHVGFTCGFLSSMTALLLVAFINTLPGGENQR